MGKDNNNSALHFRRWKGNVFEPDSRDKYAEMIAEQKAKKAYTQRQYAKVKTKPYKEAERIREKLSVEDAFQKACEFTDKLYNNLFAICVNKHIKIDQLSNEITRYWEEKNPNKPIDDLPFLYMAVQMIGVSFEELLNLSDDYIEKVVYEKILANYDEYSIIGKGSEKDIDYIETQISLVDYSEPESAAIYSMIGLNTDMTWNAEIYRKIHAIYNVNLYREKSDAGEYEYWVCVSIDSMDYENYLAIYSADIYCEKEGKVATFFEKNICT